MEVQESIKKTQIAYQQILEQRKAREQKISVAREVDEVKVSNKVDERALQKALGFSESSQNSDDEKEEISNENKVDDDISETSEDDFPPNKIIKANNVEKDTEKVLKNVQSVKVKETKIVSERKWEEITVKEPKRLPKSLEKESNIEENVKELSLTHSKDFMEDTMCKLVQYLDTEELEKSFNDPSKPESFKIPWEKPPKINQKEHTFGSSPPPLTIPSQKISKLPPKNCHTERDSSISFSQAAGGGLKSARGEIKKKKNLPKFGSEISPIGTERGVEEFMRDAEAFLSRLVFKFRSGEWIIKEMPIFRATILYFGNSRNQIELLSWFVKRIWCQIV
jgi:hypothetical protein